MSIKSAGQLRALRDQKPKPVRFKVEMTLDQIRITRLALERFALMAHPLGPSSIQIAQEVSDKLDSYLKKFIVLDQPKCRQCGSDVTRVGQTCLSCDRPRGAA